MKAWSSEKISVFALVLLITGAIDSVRTLPSTALFGASSVFFFVISALFFLIPVALISAELTSTFSEAEGGVYSWVKHAFGPKFAFFAIWLQWINTLIWYPTMLSFIAGTLAYLIYPDLAQNKFYLISVILIVFWSLTFLGLSGLKASARFAAFCAIIGMIIPMGLIILMGVLWVIQGNPLAIDLSPEAFIPKFNNSTSWSSLTAIMTAYLGMELAAVHVRNVHRPQRTFPKAIGISVLFILITMIFGSLAIAVVLPQNKISLIQGLMQAVNDFFHAYHLGFLMPGIVLMILIGSIGGMINWILSPAKGLLLAAEHGFLPIVLHTLNAHGIPSRILLLQASVVTLLCGLILFLPSINAIYWLLTDLSTELYLIMYVVMFIAALHIKSKFSHKKREFVIPFGLFGYYFICIMGLVGCGVALVVGFFPPENSMDLGGANHFRVIFSLGIVCMLLPFAVFYLKQSRSTRKIKSSAST